MFDSFWVSMFVLESVRSIIHLLPIVTQYQQETPVGQLSTVPRDGLRRGEMRRSMVLSVSFRDNQRFDKMGSPKISS